jgi:hypothetical protein
MFQAREETGSLVVKALLSQPEGDDVTVTVEDGERLAMLEDSRPVVRPRRGQDVELVLNLDDVFHGIAALKRWAVELRGRPR